MDIQSIPAGLIVPDTFEYTIDDGSGNNSVGTVTINILGQNDAPTAAPDMVATECGVGIIEVSQMLLNNDSDIDLGSVLSVVGVDSTGTIGSVLFAGGLVFYNSSAVCATLFPGQSTVDHFAYTVSDGSLTDVATVEVTVMKPFDRLDFDQDGDVDGDDICLIFWCSRPASGATARFNSWKQSPARLAFPPPNALHVRATFPLSHYLICQTCPQR